MLLRCYVQFLGILVSAAFLLSGHAVSSEEFPEITSSGPDLSVTAWVKDIPDNPMGKYGDFVQMKGVIFNDNASGPDNVDAEDLGEFINQIKELINNQFQSNSEQGELIIQVTISVSSSPEYRMSHPGGIRDNSLRQLYARLVQLKTYNSKHKQVSFQAVFRVGE
jgi:hypothetical protein